MKHSHYPAGFKNGITLRNLPVLNTYAGNVFWVDSATGSDSTSAGTFNRPFDTIDYAVGRCTADNGDLIIVKPGHTETLTAAAGLDLDVAGITIAFMGNGTDRATITFTTAVTADMDVDAANITLINPRFVAGIDALTGPIDVNAANFTMINATWHDDTAINTTDCVVADANADDMTIDGFEFVDGDAAGTQKQSFIQIAGATRPNLRHIKCTGDFGTGIIENGTAWVDAELRDLNLDNASTSPTVAILLQATSSGSAHNCHLRVASGTTYVTANNDMQWYECYGTGTDATAGELIGTGLATDLEAKIDVIDGYFDVPTADVATNTTVRDVAGNKTDAAVVAVTTTKSIMAYAKGVTNLAYQATAVGTIAAGSQLAYLPRCVEKSDGAVLLGDDDIFTISGGPVRAKITGIVTTIIGGAANGKLTITTTTPAATVDLNAGAVAVDNDAAGTSYRNVGATSVFTPVTAGMVIIDPVTVEDCEFLLPIGTVKFNSSAAQTGVIKWYMSYVPLSPNSLVVAAT